MTMPHETPPRETLSREPLTSIMSRAAENCDRARELADHAADVLTENRAIRQAVIDARRVRHSSPAYRELLKRSEQMRLIARLATMPLIEQAKGIIMAQSRCAEDEAFDLLRRASQRSNVPVRDLAAQIVAKAAHERRNAGGE